MTCTEDGYSAWGKDMGSYSYNPEVAKAIEATYSTAPVVWTPTAM